MTLMGHTMISLCHGIDGCNNHKSTKHPVIWLEKQFGKRRAGIILKRIEDYFQSIRDRLTDAIQEETDSKNSNG